MVALALLAAGRGVRQARLVGPDGAWREDLWLDSVVDPAAVRAGVGAAAGGTADRGSDPMAATAAGGPDEPAVKPGTPGDAEAGAPAAGKAPERSARPARRARGAAAAKEPPAPLDPNTATLDSLQLLPGVGPVLAGRIVAAREGGSVFRQPSDLLAVKGIGPASLARLTPFLRFPGASRPVPAASPDGDNRH